MMFRFDTTEIRVNVPDWAALARVVGERFSARDGFALATINLDHLVKLREPGAFRDAYAKQDFITADGNPIVWMSRLSGEPVELIPGSDAILPVCRVAAQHGVGVALVGSTEKSLSAAADHLEAAVPGLRVVLTVAPPFGFDPQGDDARRILGQIRDSGAGLCLVALGAPKQELFAAEGRAHAPAVGFMSIGAGLDFFSGTQTRAPRWVRGLSLEWLWRAVSSPRRLGPRYLRCLAILPGYMLSALVQRFNRPPPRVRHE